LESSSERTPDYYRQKLFSEHSKMSDQRLRVLCICLSAQYELFSQLESMSSRRRAQQDTSGLEPGALGWSCLCSWRQFSRTEGPGSCPICLGKLISFLVSDLDPTKRQARPTCDESKSSQPDGSCLFLLISLTLLWSLQSSLTLCFCYIDSR
jgi:hypothetical protein